MSTPNCLSSRAASRQLACPSASSAPPPSADWRCTCCGKLLGQFRGDRLHVRFSRGHEYLASLPAQATCRGCGTLNEAAAPKA
jgi:hypothetical protein